MSVRSFDPKMPNPAVNADAPRLGFAHLSRAGYLSRWASEVDSLARVLGALGSSRRVVAT